MSTAPAAVCYNLLSVRSSAREAALSIAITDIPSAPPSKIPIIKPTVTITSFYIMRSISVCKPAGRK